MSRPVYALGRVTGSGVIDAARRIKAWTRKALAIDDDTVVSVTELACAEPGCPPRETVVLVLLPAGGARKLSVHAAMTEVTEADVITSAAERPVRI